MTTEKPKLNVKLLRKVLRHIKSEPRRFDMSTFGSVVTGEYNAPVCGMQACIGGWAYLLSIKNATPRRWRNIVRKADTGAFDIQDRAQKALGLTSEEARSLFLTYTGNDDYDFAKAKIDLLIEDREKFVEKYEY